jgi:hypothetical protein
VPTHYALSDGLVALVGAWGAWRLVRSRQLLAAVGIALFGVAGAIGAARFGSGLVDPWAAVHRLASQIGGLAGLGLVLSEILKMTGRHHSPLTSVIGAATVAGLSVVVPAAGAILFVAGLLGGVLLLGLGKGPVRPNIRGALGFGLMLPNVILVRQSPLLGADMRWHLYHVFVALWLAITVVLLKSKQREPED